MSSDTTQQLMDQFLGALEAGDLEALNACFASDAYIWHNTDKVARTPEENSALNIYYFETFVRRDYKNRHIGILPNGAVLQFVASLEKEDGRTFDWPGCIVFEIENGCITRLEEYIDLSSLTEAMG